MLDEIVSCEFLEEEKNSYDLEVDHEDHTFFANGISVSNSHAISYAITTWQCAWFLTYYPDEWITTYLDYCTLEKGDSTGKEDPKSVAIKEIKTLGYQFTPPDINLSQYESTMHPTLPKTLVPALSSLQYVGETAVAEIMRFRPYNSLEDLLVDPNTKQWRHSKFNKRSLNTLVKLGALDSVGIVGPGKMFNNYKELHDLLFTDKNFENLKKIPSRKKKSNDITPEIQALLSGIKGKVGDWSDYEKIKFQQDLAGSVDFNLIISEETIDQLSEIGYVSLDNWEEDGKYWAVVASAEIAQTKTGNDYLKLKLFAESFKEYSCNAWNYKRGKITLQPNDIIIAEFTQKDGWFNLKINTLEKLKKV